MKTIKINDKKRFIFFISIIVLVFVMGSVLGMRLWKNWTAPKALQTELSNAGNSGSEIIKDFDKAPEVAPTKTADGFEIADDLKSGIDVQFAGQKQEDKPADGMKIAFPKTFDKPINISLPGNKTVTITDKNGKGMNVDTLVRSNQQISNLSQNSNLPRGISQSKEDAKYVKYQSSDKRKTIYYGYQKDGATDERKLKNWILYSKGNGKESEAYSFQNAKLKLDSDGNVLVNFDDGKQAQNQKAMADVDQSLLARAQKVVQADAGTDITAQNTQPDFIIPHPYYVDSKGQNVDLKWNVNTDQNEISLDFSVTPDQYPIALDPTLQFTAPGMNNSGSVITGEANSAGGVGFAYSMVSGDFNADGKMDLAVGTYQYNSTDGRVYIFYNDGLYSTTANAADAIISGDAGMATWFGYSMNSGDFNADGRTDLAVGAFWSGGGTGRAYIFYNDGSFPSTSATADVIVTGESSSQFGDSMVSGDFNADGRTDLAIGAQAYGSSAGRAYIFYNDGSIPMTAAAADVAITGEAASFFGMSMTAGDFNADGKMDLAVGAQTFGGTTGRGYIFFADGTNNFGSVACAGSNPTICQASNGDVKIDGEASSYFGSVMTSGDFNADGRSDLAVGAYGYTTNTGRAYIFYGDGTIPTTAATADVKITGETTSNYFGESVTSGDFNADGKADLAVGANGYSTNTGRAYIFYNDGFIPTTAATADVIITGEAGSAFGQSVVAGDFNSDGRTDLAVGGNSYNGAGRAYIFYSQNGQVNTNTNIIGESGGSLGWSMTSGDFNADGRTDLAVGSIGYSAGAGRAYIFYSDGSIPTTATTADVIITGEVGSDLGYSMTAGDFNADGKTDLAVGAYYYNSGIGRAYIFYNDGTNNFGNVACAGSNPTLCQAANGDVIITGEATSRFGNSMTAGDFNADGKTDLAIGAYMYSSSTGRAYIFYNDGSIPTTAAAADVIITGEASTNYLGYSMTAGDFNADGKTDLAVGAHFYSGGIGRAYVFYNDGTNNFGNVACAGSNPTLCQAANGDVIITGEANSMIGWSMTSGDFNADGRTDLAVGISGYNSMDGGVGIFYNDGSMPTTIAAADVIIVGETGGRFGASMIAGDFNADGKTDLAVGANVYPSGAGTGRAYIFYGDGSIPTTAATADVVITGAAGSEFGYSMTSGDFNADGRTDLAVGAYNYGGTPGGAHIYETRDNYVWQIQQNPYSPRILGPMGQEATTTGETGSNFGYSMVSGDFNGDGKTDLAVGAITYGLGAGRVYIFYNDGSVTSTAASADVVISGSSNTRFGSSLAAGDFNADGKMDLAVGAINVGSYVGGAYIFYNDGSFPTTAGTADNYIVGESIDVEFGTTMIAGDFNADGKTDLAVSAPYYGVSSQGRVYIFYNDGMYASTAATADVIITGEVNSDFGWSMAAGDFNADGKTDLAVGATYYNSVAGRAYIFYNDGSIPTTAATADVKIDGEAGSYFGISMTAGDFNADGKTDLVVGAYAYNTNAGRAYIFNNDGSIPTTAATADVKIDGEAGSNFGNLLIAGDFNSDGRTDLAVDAQGYNSSFGRVYIFFNDGSIPTVAANADIIITGESLSWFGASLAAGDFNADGKTDLAVGGCLYNSSTGRIYLYTLNENRWTGGAIGDSFGYSMASGDFNADGKIDLAVGAPGAGGVGKVYIFYNRGNILSPNVASADVVIIGEASSQFGSSMVSGDLNADGKTDLAVGVYSYSTLTGRAYIFYGGGAISTTAATANVIITGETTSNLFGYSMTAGDFNGDGKMDLAVGANGYGSNAGRAYIFYNDGSIPTTAATADVKIDGEASSSLGDSMTSGDFNSDGRIDLAVGATGYSTGAGRAYIFNNDGTIPTTAATADVKIDGEVGSDFGWSMTSGDFNADNRVDLAVGATQAISGAGRSYIFNNDGSIPTTAATADVKIDGEANSRFGFSMTGVDFNADGKTDLAIGAYQYSSGLGRAYVFYNDGSFPISAASAIEKIDGEVNSTFGYAMTFGDFNRDGKADLVVGATGYNSSAGKVYTYISEVNPDFNNAQIKIRGRLNIKGSVRMQ